MAKAQAAAATQTTTPTRPATSARASDTSAQGPNAATKADLDQTSDTPASSSLTQNSLAKRKSGSGPIYFGNKGDVLLVSRK